MQILTAQFDTPQSDALQEAQGGARGKKPPTGDFLMSARIPHPQSRRHIWVYDEDWEWLDDHFGTGSANPIGVGPTCREIIHQRVKALKAKVAERLDRGSEAADG